MNQFTDNDKLYELFGPRCGSFVENGFRLTYVPTGAYWPTLDYFSVNGCRTFPASNWDYMLGWMQSCCPGDLLTVQNITR